MRITATPPALPAILFTSLFVAGLAYADPAQDALAEVAKCADIADSGDRLKCYDKAASLAKSALAAPATKAASKERSFLEWFGFSKPPPPQTAEEFGKPTPPPTPEEVRGITANVLEYARTPRGLSVFILENGQIWKQVEGDTTVVRDPLPTPMRVTIETGFLGSYNLTIEGRNGLIKVGRLK
jgi:hypothetical protein